jgi:hypothetical protein
MCKRNTTVDALNSNAILFIFIKLAKNVKQLSLRHLWYQFDHLVEHNRGLFANVGHRVSSNLVEDFH